MADPRLTSTDPLRSPGSRLSLSFPFLREGSRMWEDGVERPRQLPSPRPPSARAPTPPRCGLSPGPCLRVCVRTSAGHRVMASCAPPTAAKTSCSHLRHRGGVRPGGRRRGHLQVSLVPPKNLKVQAVEVKIIHLNPGTKHETWSGQILSS
ncbi:unnamed protein product [Lota lota]